MSGDAATPTWANDPGGEALPPADPGAVLVDLLGLVDALPAIERTELAFPPFKRLVARRSG